MNISDRWSVGLNFTGTDGRTHAEARLVMPGRDELVGRGDARRNPADREVPLIGEQIAAARALSDLTGQLLHTAAVGIEHVTHEPAGLYLLPARGTSGPVRRALPLRGGLGLEVLEP